MSLQEAKMTSLKDKLYSKSVENILAPQEEPKPAKKKFNKKEKKEYE